MSGSRVSFDGLPHGYRRDRALSNHGCRIAMLSRRGIHRRSFASICRSNAALGQQSTVEPFFF
jgi:hypothetical protein